MSEIARAFVWKNVTGLAIQQLIRIQILLLFIRFKLLTNLYSNATDLKLGSATYACSFRFLYSQTARY